MAIPYTGGPAQAVSDVVSGRVGLFIEGYSAIAGAVESGSVKTIAVASREPLAEFPGVPTVAETLPGFSATRWQVLVAPIGTPETIIAKISEDLRKVVSDPNFKKTIAIHGNYTRTMSPAEAAVFVQAEQVKWKPVAGTRREPDEKISPRDKRVVCLVWHRSSAPACHGDG